MLGKWSLAVLALLALTLVAAGCGSGDDGDDKGDKGKDGGSKSGKSTKSKDPKIRQVAEAEKAFEKDSRDVNSCRNLALSYVALASPTSTGKEGDPVKPPKDRNKNMKRAAKTYERCRELAPKDIDIQRSLASSYMSVGDYEKASPLLEDVAKAAKTNANDYYAWGLAASNAQDSESTIEAWQLFLRHVTPKSDPRVAQVRRSLTLLRQEQKNPAPPVAPPASTTSTTEDKGGDKGEDN